ncbi:hypothetical protein RDWZM_001967 [Blomia tropicalis]|uniref:THUMP domain-containing protein n=1 Tax=Blomia tropicalis TaxID=40697 RepID=A0A9Q0MF72_BLOTA|nr:THUMP domain-containing protein 3 [Blomia tropicalis]KAJ6223422.1 hypothetical protein RDWZM_001967 [Blomia tropicalis]
MASSDIITYDATVVTGLEKLAIKEIREKISIDDDIQHSMGHVFIRTVDRYEKLSKLHSIDNVYVLIYRNDNVNLSDADEGQIRDFFNDVIDQSEWTLGMKVWSEASKFTHSDISTILNLSSDQGDYQKPSFRVSCNRTGKHKITSQDACGIFGGLINDIFHWPVSLKQFDLELLLTIKNDSLKVSICLSKESLYKRYIVEYGLTTLRGTIAFNLIQVAQIQPGDIVCDPMCGSGTIPVETGISWPETFVLGGDNNSTAIGKSLINCSANNYSITNIVQWDCTSLPIRTNSIDVFITDLPFGRRHGSKHINKSLYPAILTEMVRCSCTQSGRIVLLTQDKTNANRCISDPRIRKYIHHEKSFFVKIGGLDSSIYLLKRNSNCFKEFSC